MSRLHPMAVPSHPPLVLAGPIVRRTTPDRVHVWLATSRILDPPHLTLYAGAGTTARTIPSDPEWYLVVMGKRLIVYLLVARPREALTPGRTYEYDILLDGLRPLFDEFEMRQIVLRGRSRPSFVLGQVSRPEMRAIYGSCRKLHGPRPDMMRAAEQILQEARVGERPEYLFLGGDQIYADDVHPSVLALSGPLQAALFAKPEVVPGLEARAYSTVESRADYLKPFFTSTHMDHHLLTLGEYVTAYLLAWNPNVWSYLVGLATVISPVLLPAGGVAGLRSARRVLANVVTYMIFDDHEITDDWFRTEKWTENALKHRVAERVITNGLVAYWAFQGWGNDPDVFDEDFRNLMSVYAESGGRHQEEVWRSLARTRWSYLAPTSPPVLVLDTRTRRGTSEPYEDAVDFGFRRGALHPLSPGILAQGIQSRPDVQYRRRNVEAPRLLNAEERTRLRELVAAREPRNSPFIVISPSPIFGFPPLEWLQEESGRVVPDVADLESWGANPRNLIDAMELFASHRPDPLLILSGDVHYGFEVVGRIHKTNGSVPFVQLCSSAFKNKAVQREAQSLKLLSRFSNKDRSVAYWDLRQADQDDGALAWMDVKRPSVDVFSALFGIPAMILETQFVRRSGRLDVHERIEMENNLGDLVIRGGRVSHRHWVAANGGRLIAREWSDWRTSNWPVADPLTSLINAIVGAP